ncbi:MAG: hypothetical protein R6U63_09280 [Longimicrobiales bacterium]
MALRAIMSAGAETRRAAPGRTGGRFGAFRYLALVLLLAVPVQARAQFSVYPVQVQLELGSSVGTQTLTVQNQASDPLDLTVYVNDYDRDAAGDHQYFPFGEHPSSCEGRLEVFPDQLSIPAGGIAEVRVRVRPEAGTCWAVVFVERRTQAPTGITVAQRIGAKIIATSGVLAGEGRVVGMAADTTAEPAALLAFANEGRGPLDVEGEIEIRSLEGEVVGVVPVESFRVLPGRQRRIRVPLNGVTLEPGRYVLVGILDFGADYLAGGQAMLEVRP